MSTAAQPVPTETSTSPLAPLVLIADDQPHILDALELLLEPEGYRIEKATSPYMVSTRSSPAPSMPCSST